MIKQQFEIMDIRVSKSEASGEVQSPPSKSVAHRKMIGAALAGCPFEACEGGRDMLATARCLKGLKPYIDSYLNGGRGAAQASQVLNAGESGSTLRFLLPVACALGADVVFEGEGRLRDRPLGGLIDALNAHGAVIRRVLEAQLPLRVGGRLEKGEFKIDGSVSSQYITGLLFALPLLNGDSRIVIDGGLVSRSYVDITLGVLAEFGIDIEVEGSGYFVRGNQRYKMSSDLGIEGDWSSASFMLALGVLAGEVVLKGLNSNSLQGDKAVVDLLRRAGADITLQGGDYIAKKSELHAIDFDANDCPDAVPIMATALSFARGASHILHVDRLRDKESDRLDAVRKMLGGFGIKTEYESDVLTVIGGAHRACTADSFNDHRMAMSAIVSALATEGESTVLGAECIDKSYPGFIADLAKLGVNVAVLR